MSQQGLRFTLEVDELMVADTAVVSFTLYQNLSTPFLLSVDIASNLANLTAVSFLEKNATLTIWQGNTPLRYLHGIITGMETGENDDWQMNYSLTISPPLWRCG
ncbi:contractile injection system protein, VgrG/Pvc8 family, partial [Citrobacter portucalensis]